MKEYPIFIFLDKNEQEVERKQGEISEKEILDLINKYKSSTLPMAGSDSGGEK